MDNNSEILDPEEFLPYSICPYSRCGDFRIEKRQVFRTYDRISESEKSLYLWLFYPNSSEKPFGPARFVPGNDFDSLEELELYSESVGKKPLRVAVCLKLKMDPEAAMNANCPKSHEIPPQELSEA